MSEIPASLREYADRGPDWAGWLDGLPRLLDELLAEWELTPDGASRHGHTSLVVPVRTGGGRPAVLKLTRPHPEGEHEALALQKWAGRAAVRLLRADPRRWALLLERLSDEDLSQAWDVQACEVVGGLYRALHVPAPPQLALLSQWSARQASLLRELPRDVPVPRRMVEQAASLARSFAADEATDGVLLHTDLHYANVLARDEGEWVAVGPKPLSGDPHYEPAPLLWSLFDGYAGRAREGIRDRFFAVVDAAGLDEERARDWTIVRVVVNAVGELVHHGASDRARVTMLLTIAKAVQG